MRQQGWLVEWEELVEKEMKEGRVPGFVMGVNLNGQSLFRKSFGYRDREKELEITPDTVMGLASVTKSFTCMAIMQLQEAKKLSVHDPVIKYLPEFRTPDRQKTEQMTIHHFMTHTTGIPPLPIDNLAIRNSMLDDMPDEDNPIHRYLKKEYQKPIYTFEELMEALALAEYELVGSPGELFSYSNDCYSLLGAVIARVSGKSYDEYVKEHILEPAAMKSSTFLLSDLPHLPDVTTIYHFKENNGVSEIYPDPNWEDGLLVAASGHLNSTVHDMLNYAEIFRTGGCVGKERILSEESVKQMIYPHVQISYGRYYGYGLSIQPDYYGGTLIKHGGAIKGVAAHLAIVPERGITSMALANLIGSPVEKATLTALHAVEGRPLNTPQYQFETYSVPTAQLGEYVGRYVSGEGVDIIVYVVEDALMMIDKTSDVFGGGKQLNCLLRPIGEHQFITDREGSELTVGFVKGEDGVVKAMSLYYRIIPRVAATEGSRV
ncbi:beta-lactamase family protein [Brevibacillus sp. HB1.3]|uniref:serine hydrolase domain-containing protein n=1 Tax=Brevibacillus sp. HB1.3 TaxID=2738842 RepID=UPI0015578A6B|nr:serine hydrolase domain-containing protein [Brevibacillus sp. HB1.3]NQF16292.1 beta-lactamase family protein [Brevibacillus sp. HB1.3]